MTNQRYVIKYGPLYYNHLGDFTDSPYNAYMAIHSEVAFQTKIDKKLPEGCKVYMINFVEVVIESNSYKEK